MFRRLRLRRLYKISPRAKAIIDMTARVDRTAARTAEDRLEDAVSSAPVEFGVTSEETDDVEADGVAVVIEVMEPEKSSALSRLGGGLSSGVI